MVILGNQNKITDFLMILACVWAFKTKNIVEFFTTFVFNHHHQMDNLCAGLMLGQREPTLDEQIVLAWNPA